MRWALLAASVVIVVAGRPAYAATHEDPDNPPSDAAIEPQFVPAQLAVKISTALPIAEDQTAFASQNGLMELSRAPDLGWVRFALTDGTELEQKAAALRRNPYVLDVERILIGHWTAFPQTAPNDPQWPNQWGFQRADMLSAWQIAGGGSSSRPLAIVDSGVDTNHPDLGLIQGANFVGGSSINDGCKDPPQSGHGTRVAGVAAAFTNNAKGVAGVAYNAPIWSLRISGPNCAPPDITAAAQAINYAVNIGAYAINASWGFDLSGVSEAEVDQLRDAVDFAWSANIPVVVAAGNENQNGFNNLVPAKWTTVITVGGTDSADLRCTWVVQLPEGPTTLGANYGAPGLDVSAPCENITSTKWGGGYGTADGTSFSAPFVSGIVYLIKSEHPNWTSSQIKAAIQNSADNVGPYSYTWRDFCNGQSAELGCGLLDPEHAVD